MMNSELIDLVLNYAYRKREIDDEFILETISTAVVFYSLGKYIKSVYIVKDLKDAIALYIPNDKIIVVNIYAILQSIDNINKEYSCMYNSLLFKYLYCIQILLHEVEHAKQQKLLLNNDSIESEILNAEFGPYLNYKDSILIKRIIKLEGLKRKQKKFYIYSPSERLAQTKSIDIVLEISKTLKDNICYDYFEQYKLYTLLKGYNVGWVNYLSDTPTKFYLQNINPKYDFDKISNMCVNLNFDNLIKFGMELPKDELYKTLGECKNLVLKLQKRSFYINKK